MLVGYSSLAEAQLFLFCITTTTKKEIDVVELKVKEEATVSTDLWSAYQALTNDSSRLPDRSVAALYY